RAPAGEQPEAYARCVERLTTEPRRPWPGILEGAPAMRTTINRTFALAAISAIALGVPNVTVSAQTPAERPQFPPPKPEVQPPAVETNLKTFDVLDFDVFSN